MNGSLAVLMLSRATAAPISNNMASLTNRDTIAIRSNDGR